MNVPLTGRLSRLVNRQRRHTPTDLSRSEALTLEQYVHQVFNHEEYLRSNPDVAEAGVDPVDHWLNHGVFETRPLSENTIVVLNVDPPAEAEGQKRKFEWKGVQVSIVERENTAKETDVPGLEYEPPAAELQFLQFAVDNFDEEFYLASNPDVREDGSDPLAHYLNHGALEGRSPSADLVVKIEAEAQHFKWKGNSISIAPREVVEEPEVCAGTGAQDVPHVTEPDSDESFAIFVKQQMDREVYLAAYEDVRRAGVDPVEHWLDSGIWQGRMLSPRIMVAIGERAERRTVSPVLRFKWRGTSVSVCMKRMSDSILSQILAQSQHDGAVVAPGANAIAGLREFDAIDLMARNDADVQSIFSAVQERPDVVLITPFLCAGGAEKYVSDLVGALQEAGRGPILVIVTEHTRQAAGDWEKLSILAPLTKARVLFWPDVFGPGHANPVYFARALSALFANTIVVNNSRLGLDAVSRFGRGLSQNSKIFCTYFSHGINALGAPYGARFPHKTMPFATTLTDNGPMAALMGKMWSGLSEHPVVKLSAKVDSVEEPIFLERVEARRQLASHAFRPHKWVWVSRIERFKGTEVLAHLARLRPSDEFHLFGPVDGSLAELGLTGLNLIHHGVLENVATHSFSEYDGFVFTSLFEGMPNVVLEMSQHAIPLVLADVGGLRGTFSEKAAIYVTHDDSSEATARLFSSALDAIIDLSPVATVEMVTRARDQALETHASDVYLDAVKAIFGGRDV
ncbi:glycosyltransferase [Paraburkholderia sp. FT54]|uniref:glycosyltransferase n=1 Tax=Paraburkholderia sp. FT54 TaxID=3074437 RepID=UPI002877E1D2|nr:glycosyltransferase [Paraburkholderia sp. FT54]WNC89267.1 glycosyltransferase [Paraburkholderia sp. FT54]